MDRIRSVLIKDTTREERMRIVAKGLDWCGDASCETCSGCSLGAPRIEAMYAPYIDGKLELAEINMLHAATKYTHG
jgi:NADH:ubiquinone oxidoreductase subunit F (NADH-binding)